MQTLFDPEPAIGIGYGLLSFSLAQAPASPVFDSQVHHLTVIQMADGSWAWNLPRPPIQSSTITATALSARALRDYPIPGCRREFEDRIQRARAWLGAVPTEFTEERAYQLLGLSWAGKNAANLKTLAAALILEQREDGGWGQLPKLPSDAYATGQAIYALLAAAELAPGETAVRRGPVTSIGAFAHVASELGPGAIKQVKEIALLSPIHR